MSDESSPAGWRTRIVGSGTEVPEDLLAHPSNYRIHSMVQQKTLESVLDTVGWVRPVIVNKRTNRVIDGHMRIAVAMRRGETSVPVDYVDLTEDEEDAVLATFDPIAMMAATNHEALKRLVAVSQGAGIDTAAILDAYRLNGGVRTYGTEEDGRDGLKPGADRESVADKYQSSAVRQIYLMMTQPEYETMIVTFRAIALAHDLSTNLDVLLWLIEQYEAETPA